MIAPRALFRTLIIACAAAVLAFAPARAQRVVTVTTTTVTWTWEEIDGDENAAPVDDESRAGDVDRRAARHHASSGTPATHGQVGARFGPFAVIDASTARMAGDVTAATPRQFAAMLADFPGLKRIEMVDCPGSLDEDANLILARAVRRAGLETVVPSGGSVRSGAVELWLAGIHRRAAPDAEFGVHSWIDENGREARDYPASDPVHAEYLSYYREMGLDDVRARAFYALTNSTPFDKVRYLTRNDMAQYVTIN